MKYISGKYVQGELLENIREIEDWITDYYVHYGAVSDGVLQSDMDRRVRDASFGRNAVFFDDLDFPSIMVRFPSTKLSEIDSSWADAPHQAFLLNGRAKNEFWIGKYLPIVNGSGETARAVSLRRKCPKHSINFDDSLLACTQKGSGWHLMTNAEWALILLTAHKNQFFCHGNTNNGKYYYKTSETAEACYLDAGAIAYTATGTGPVAWSHDGSPFGVFDLNGNVDKRVAGIRLYDGEIQIFENNNAADGTKDHSSTSTEWKAILQDGSLVTPGTADTLKMDRVGGVPAVGITIEDQLGSGEYYTACFFNALQAKSGTTIPDILKQLGLFPKDTSYKYGRIYIHNLGERMVFRGGAYNSSTGGGVDNIGMHTIRTYTHPIQGFVLAYQEV